MFEGKEKIHLEDDQELIGVYGVENNYNYFTSFGFLVKQKKRE